MPNVSFSAFWLERHPAPTHLSDVERELDSPITAADAVATLQRDGLVHVADHLVVASRAAVRDDELRL